MPEMAKRTGLAREALYKSLRPEGSPQFDTVYKIAVALGYKIVVKPMRK